MNYSLFYKIIYESSVKKSVQKIRDLMQIIVIIVYKYVI